MVHRSTRGLRAHLVTFVLLFLAAAAPVGAQMPPVGIIDFYGLRTLRPADLAAAVRLQIGDSVTEPVNAIRARLVQVPGVRDAAVNAVCCEAGRLIVYVGVRETGTQAVGFMPAPAGSARLPAHIVTTADDFLSAVFEGVRRGENAEDDEAGHAVVLYAPARLIQQTLIDYATRHPQELRTVLRTSADPRHRALAAQMLAYVPDKAAIVADLVAAVHDADAGVRNNAIRALAVMALHEQKHPESGLRVPYEPFIDLLGSLDWTDRNKAAFALVALTGNRDPAVLAKIREQALPELIEMTRWKSLGHAAAPGMILGRIAGIAEDQIFPMLQKNREGVIAAALAD